MNEKQDETDSEILLDSTVLCRGICRNGTGCLNRGKYNGYCRWHRDTFAKLTNLGAI